MTSKIFFDKKEDADAVSLNIGEPVEDLSIEVDPDELVVSLKQVDIKGGYSIAVVSEPE